MVNNSDNSDILNNETAMMSGEMQRNTKKCREMREIQRNAEN